MHAAHRPRAATGPVVPGSGPIPQTTSLPFPACCHATLEMVTKHARNTLANRGRQPPKVAADLQLLIDNELFCMAGDRKSCRLNSLQQLSLVHIITQYFMEHSDATAPMRNTIFELMFLGRDGEPGAHQLRMKFLYRFASFALQFPVLNIFVQIGQWLSNQRAGEPYAEELISLLAEHYIAGSDETKHFEYLIPLENVSLDVCTLFLIHAPRQEYLGAPLASVVGSIVTRHPAYIVNSFRDSPKMAEHFAKTVFPLLLGYSVAEDRMNEAHSSLHAACLVFLEKWKAAASLDCSPLWDPSLQWTRRRSECVLVISHLSAEKCNELKEKLDGEKIPAPYAGLVAEAQAKWMEQ